MKRSLFFLFTMLMAVSVLNAKPKVGAGCAVISHRGYWNTEGSTPNSIASLEKAIALGTYGSELDVYLTTDGKVVLFHDSSYKGRRIDAMSFDETQQIKLANGEPLPLLERVLQIARKQSRTKPIIEVKSHATPQLENEAVDAILKLVHQNKMDRKVEFISFSRNICERIIAKAPKAKVAYLGGELSPKELSALGYTGLDYHIGTMRAHPEWFKEAHDLRLTVNVWTVNDEENMRWLIAQGADFITTDNPVLLNSLIAK